MRERKNRNIKKKRLSRRKGAEGVKVERERGGMEWNGCSSELMM